MNPSSIPFNALVVGPTNSGKSRFVVNQLHGPFSGKFDFIVLICQETWLMVTRRVFEGSNTLIILDDCAASKDVKGRTGELVDLAFSASHIDISVWVLTQKYTSITASFRENMAAIIPFYTLAAKTMKSVFEDFAGELSVEEYKALIARPKARNYAHLVFSLREPNHRQRPRHFCSS